MIILEDDINWEYVEKWESSLAKFLYSLRDDVEIVQLGHGGAFLRSNLQRNTLQKILLIPWQVKYTGAYAYAVNRKGMRNILEKMQRDKGHYAHKRKCRHYSYGWGDSLTGDILAIHQLCPIFPRSNSLKLRLLSS